LICFFTSVFLFVSQLISTKTSNVRLHCCAICNKPFLDQDKLRVHANDRVSQLKTSFFVSDWEKVRSSVDSVKDFQLGAYPRERGGGGQAPVPPLCRTLTLLANIRLGRKELPVTNALAYFALYYEWRRKKCHNATTSRQR
jgi:hypothetical protein